MVSRVWLHTDSLFEVVNTTPQHHAVYRGMRGLDLTCSFRFMLAENGQIMLEDFDILFPLAAEYVVFCDTQV